jgi:hypothetical protein
MKIFIHKYYYYLIIIIIITVPTGFEENKIEFEDFLKVIAQNIKPKLKVLFKIFQFVLLPMRLFFFVPRHGKG